MPCWRFCPRRSNIFTLDRSPFWVLSRVMRKYNSVTYEVGKAKAEQAAGMFGLAAGQLAVCYLSQVTAVCSVFFPSLLRIFCKEGLSVIE